MRLSVVCLPRYDPPEESLPERAMRDWATMNTRYLLNRDTARIVVQSLAGLAAYEGHIDEGTFHGSLAGIFIDDNDITAWVNGNDVPLTIPPRVRA